MDRRSHPSLKGATYDTIVNESIKARLQLTYHVYARFNFFQSDDVRFYEIRDRILTDFRVSVNDRPVEPTAARGYQRLLPWRLPGQIEGDLLDCPHLSLVPVERRQEVVRQR